MTMDLDRRSFLQMLGMAGTAVVMPVGLMPAAAENVEPDVAPFEPLTVEDVVLSVWKDGAWVPLCGVWSFSVELDESDYYVSGLGRRQYVGLQSPRNATVQINGRILHSRYDVLREVFDGGKGLFQISGDLLEIEFDGFPTKLHHRVDSEYVETDLAIIMVPSANNTGFDFRRIYHP